MRSGLAEHVDYEAIRNTWASTPRVHEVREIDFDEAVARDGDGRAAAFCQFVPARGISGWSLDLIERHAAVAGAASGMHAGAFHPLLARDDSYAARLSRAMSVDALLARSGWAEAKREFMLGDASTRAYERLEKPDGTKGILMISPKRPDGPPVRYGKPYSQIAHLAEDVIPFFAIQRGLLLEGFSLLFP